MAACRTRSFGTPYAYVLLHVGSPGQHAAAVRGGVEHPEPTIGGRAKQRLGRPIQQGVPVVAQHHLELTGVEIALQESHRSTGDAEMRHEPPVAKIHQGLHRTAGSDPLLEGDPFGVMEVQQGDPVDAQPFHRLLDRGTDPIAGEVPGPRIRVDLGREHDVGRQSTDVSDRRSDPALGGAVLAVAVRGVDEGEGTVEGGEDRGDGAVLVHGVAVQVGHAGQRTGSEADRRHGQPGPPELSWTLGLPWALGLAAQRSTPADSGGYPSVTMAVSFAITMSSRKAESIFR